MQWTIMVVWGAGGKALVVVVVTSKAAETTRTEARTARVALTFFVAANEIVFCLRVFAASRPWQSPLLAWHITIFICIVHGVFLLTSLSTMLARFRRAHWALLISAVRNSIFYDARLVATPWR